MVLCGRAARKDFSEYAKVHQGKVGWLLSPSGWKTPKSHIPFALDNDAFAAWKNQTPWNEVAWRTMLLKCKSSRLEPLWALVPDVVANREATIRKWWQFVDTLDDYGYRKAFAVQDGMTPDDVPVNASVIFIGGTTKWKWRTLPMWCKNFPRVHVGRVNTGFRLEIAERNGAESVDGTGFFRKQWGGEPARQFRAFVEGHRDTTLELPLA